MNQVEVNVRDHGHGAAGVSQTVGAAPTASGHYAHKGMVDTTAKHTAFLFGGATLSSGDQLRGFFEQTTLVTSQFLRVPSGKTFKLLRLEGYLLAPSTVGTYVANFDVWNATAGTTTMVGCAAVQQNETMTVVRSGSLQTPLATLTGSTAWQLRVSIVAAAAAVNNDTYGITGATYEYE